VTVIAKLPGDGTERVLTVGGPLSHGTLGVGFSASDGAAAITAASGASYTVSLSTVGVDTAPQTVSLGTIAIPAGGTVTLRPSSWSDLPAGRLVTSLTTAHGERLPTAVKRHAVDPTATIKRITIRVAAKAIHVTAKVNAPQLLVGQSAVGLTVTERSGKRIVAHRALAIRAGGPAHTATVFVSLPGPVPKYAKLKFALITENGGTTPSRSLVTATRTVR
jgi:hypothetical protein